MHNVYLMQITFNTADGDEGARKLARARLQRRLDAAHWAMPFCWIMYRT